MPEFVSCPRCPGVKIGSIQTWQSHCGGKQHRQRGGTSSDRFPGSAGLAGSVSHHAVPVRTTPRPVITRVVRPPPPPPNPMAKFMRYPIPSHDGTPLDAKSIGEMAVKDRKHNDNLEKERYSYDYNPSSNANINPYIVCAAAYGSLDVVKGLIRRGVKVDCARRWIEEDRSKSWTWNGDSPLAAAVMCKQLEMFKYLLSQRADVNFKICVVDDEYYTPKELVDKMTDVVIRTLFTNAMANPTAYQVENQDADGDVAAVGNEWTVNMNDCIMMDINTKNILAPALKSAFEKMGDHTKRTKAVYLQKVQEEQAAIMANPNRIPEECLSKVTVPQLKNFLKVAKQPVGGKKAELESRFIEYRDRGGTFDLEQVAALVEQKVAEATQQAAVHPTQEVPLTANDGEPPEGYTSTDIRKVKYLMTDPRFVSEECRTAIKKIDLSKCTVAELDKALALLPRYAIQLQWIESSKSTKVNYIVKAKHHILRDGIGVVPSTDKATNDQLKEFLRSATLPTTGAKAALIEIVNEFVWFHGAYPQPSPPPMLRGNTQLTIDAQQAAQDKITEKYGGVGGTQGAPRSQPRRNYNDYAGYNVYGGGRGYNFNGGFHGGYCSYDD